MELSYSSLRNLYRFEKNKANLSEVEETFYADLVALIKEEKKKYVDSLANLSVSNARDFINLQRLVEEIYDLREKKILNRALIASRTSEITYENMASEEKALFNELVKQLSKQRAALLCFFSSNKKDADTDIALNSNLSIKILKRVPSFVDTDLKQHGPFEEGQVVMLPEKIAKLFVDKQFAVISEK